MISRRLSAAVAAVLAMSAILSGCGGSGAGSSNSGSGSAAVSEASSQALKDTAAVKVAEFSRFPTAYPGGTTPFDPGTGRAAVLACGSGAAICVEQAQNAVDALNAMGWEAPPPVDGQFSPLVQGGFIDRAVQDDLDGVIIVSVDVKTIKASIDRAVAAGLPMVCVSCTSGDEYQGKVFDIAPDWYEQGVMGAWAILADGGEGTHTVTFSDDAFAPPPLRAAGLIDTITQNCPSCTTDLVKFPTSSNGKPGPPEWNAYLASHPRGQIDYAVGHYDGLAMPLVRTSTQSGRDEIKVGGYDGEKPNLNALSTGELPLLFSVAYGYTYETWAGADVLGRMKAGLPLPENMTKIPNMLVQRSQAEQLLEGNPPPSTFPAPDGDWQGEFLRLWGKQV